LRTSNKYHKFFGEYQVRTDRTTYEDLKRPFKFNYVDDEIRKEVKNLFPAFEFTGTSTVLITQDVRAKDITPKCRVWLDGAKWSVSGVPEREVHLLGGQRFKNRKKTYLIELEQQR
jgi:hypothetical protein